MANLTIASALHDQISGFPTKAEVAKKLEMYRRIVDRAGGFPGGLQLTGEGLSIGMPPNGVGGKYRNDSMVKMLKIFAEETGTKLPKELELGFLGIDTSLALQLPSLLKDTEVSGWVNTGSELMVTALSKSSTNPDFGGEALALGTMTIEAIRSGGYISNAQTRSMAMTAGGTAGAVIGSIFPVVGNAVGAVVGTIVGAAIGSIIGAFTKPDFAAIEARAKEEAKRANTLLKRACTDHETQFNEFVFQKVFEISTKWINAENTLGYRIPLRWFESNPGLRFEGAAQRGEPFMDRLLGSPSGAVLNQTLTPKSLMDGYAYPHGKFRCFTDDKLRQGKIDYAGRTWTVRGQEQLGICNFYCPEKILGCLYPQPAGNQFHMYGSPRVIAAYYSRGFDIPARFGCSTIPLVTDYVEKPEHWGKTTSKGEQAEQEYMTAIAEELKKQSRVLVRQANQQTADFTHVSNIVTADLIRTIALMKSQQNILMNEVFLASTGVLDDVTTKFAGMRADHIRNMKNIALVGGAGLLGTALWRALR